MRTVPVLTIAVLLAVVGCTATGPDPVAAPPLNTSVTTSARPSPTPVPTTPPRTAADGTDLSACVDGSCEVRVDGPAEIPVPRRGGLHAVRVEQGASGLLLVVLGPSGFRTTMVGSGRASMREGAVVTMEDIGGGSAIVTVNAG